MSLNIPIYKNLNIVVLKYEKEIESIHIWIILQKFI